MNKIGLSNAKYFEATNPKLETISELLDSKLDKDKMEGMKRLIAMISKGRDVSPMFPAVVKNVVCPNIEIKKLVYMYLVHYAELEPEASLLAINTFQKDLTDHNQLIRAMALRVMSSIRVRMILQLVVLAIKKAANDSSAYVRKTAAHAIPKVYSQDHEQKGALIEIIELLLNDQSTLVLGSAVAAFNEVASERLDLIHSHFRKLCHLVADIDEWGQVCIVHMFTRYARTYFRDADANKLPKKPRTNPEKMLKVDDSDDSSDEYEEPEDDDEEEDEGEMDVDHRLMLTSVHPLLQSRNTAVVLAVATLYHCVAPKAEAQEVGKSLVRAQRNHREIQHVILTNIASLAARRPSMFVPYVSEFFVTSRDPTAARKLKLEIITYLATENNIHQILREFKIYVRSEDKEFVTATIEAIGRAAMRINEVASTCLHGLMSLLSNRSEAVVAQAVVEIKKLLQSTGSAASVSEITALARSLDTIREPSARASIVWVVGEYCHRIPRVAPDVLRVLCRSFVHEDTAVRLQALSLASKLRARALLPAGHPDSLEFEPRVRESLDLMFSYVLSLARYDRSYDLRDRSRSLRQLLSGESPLLQLSQATLLLGPKPAPTPSMPADVRTRYVLGTLSHLVAHPAFGYTELPEFPTEVPPSSIRNPKVVDSQPRWEDDDRDDSSDASSSGRSSPFYSSGSRDTSDDSSYSSDGGSGSGSEYSGSESDGDYSDYSSSEEEVPVKPSSRSRPNGTQPSQPARALDDMFDFGGAGATRPASTGVAVAMTSMLDDLEGLDFSATSMLAPSSGAPSRSSSSQLANYPVVASSARESLLKHMVGGGLGVTYAFLRRPSTYGNEMNTVQLYFKNHSNKPINNIRVGKQNLGPGMKLIEFAPISVLGAGQTYESVLNVGFNTITQAAQFEIWTEVGKYPVTLPPAVGDLVRAVKLDIGEFETAQKKLQGMNESSNRVAVQDLDKAMATARQCVLECANMREVEQSDSDRLCFAACTFKGLPLLFSLERNDSANTLVARLNCEDTILGAMLLDKLRRALVA